MALPCAEVGVGQLGLKVDRRGNRDSQLAHRRQTSGRLVSLAKSGSRNSSCGDVASNDDADRDEQLDLNGLGALDAARQALAAAKARKAAIEAERASGPEPEEDDEGEIWLQRTTIPRRMSTLMKSRRLGGKGYGNGPGTLHD